MPSIIKEVQPDIPEVLDHFVVRAMSSDHSPDTIRSKLDKRSPKLALQMRKCLTLPPDAQDPTRHLAQSKSFDCALMLPQAHCAFRDCPWIGASTEMLLSHLEDQFMDSQVLKLCKTKRVNVIKLKKPC